MTKKKATLFDRVRSTFRSAMSGAKKMAGVAKEKIEIDAQFARLATKWDRISKGVVNLDPTLLGIFDRTALTLTVRVKDALEKGELLESERRQYRVEEIRPEPIQLPVEIEQVAHLVPCKVAVLAKI